MTSSSLERKVIIYGLIQKLCSTYVLLYFYRPRYGNDWFGALHAVVNRSELFSAVVCEFYNLLFVACLYCSCIVFSISHWCATSNFVWAPGECASIWSYSRRRRMVRIWDRSLRFIYRPSFSYLCALFRNPMVMIFLCSETFPKSIYVCAAIL